MPEGGAVRSGGTSNEDGTARPYAAPGHPHLLRDLAVRRRLGAVDEQSAIQSIRHARELGINFFDTAQGYGFGIAERLLGQALTDELRSDRDSLVIATKGGLRMDGDTRVRDSSPAWLRRGVEQSLDALDVDHVDLYQVHWPDPTTPLAETAGALQELVEEGLVRHVGVSNFEVAELHAFAAVRPVETRRFRRRHRLPGRRLAVEQLRLHRLGL